VDQEEVDRYKATCSAIIGNTTLALPDVIPEGSSSSNADQVSSRVSLQVKSPTTAKPVGTTSLQRSQLNHSRMQTSRQLSKDIYWCVDKIYSEPSETVLCPVHNSETLVNDVHLYREVNRAIKEARRAPGTFEAWLMNLISWKICTKVDFVKVNNISKDIIKLRDVELTDSTSLTWSGPTEIKSTLVNMAFHQIPQSMYMEL
jgi:hypothetical protein